MRLINMNMNLTDFDIVFCTYFDNKKEFIYRNEAYEEYVLFCVENGSFNYGYSSEEICKYTAKSGDVVLCCPNRMFYRKAITPINFCMIKFIPKFVIPQIDTPIYLSDTSRFFKNISMLKSSFYYTNETTDHITNHYCRDIVYQVFLSISEKNTPISDAINFINLNYTTPISINKLANNSGYSMVHFINLFKKYTGYTPKGYISFLRLKKAQYFLKNSFMSISEISAECGFSDNLYFCRFFKAHCGMTPTEFKKSVKI